MKRTLLMAEIGQDNTWGIYKPGQMDKQWFCCKLELKDEIGLGGPRHLLSRTAWAVWFQGDTEAKDDSRKPEKEVSWSLLPITPHNLAGQDHWADSSPQRFLLPLRELAFPGSHLFSPRETAGITFACPPQCHLQKPGPKPSATAAHSTHWLCRWLRTQRAGSLEKVLTAQMVKATIPIHFGTSAFGLELRKRHIIALGPKGFIKESQSFIYYFYTVWNFGFKKKNPNSSVSGWTISQIVFFTSSDTVFKRSQIITFKSVY